MVSEPKLPFLLALMYILYEVNCAAETLPLQTCQGSGHGPSEFINCNSQTVLCFGLVGCFPKLARYCLSL